MSEAARTDLVSRASAGLAVIVTGGVLAAATGAVGLWTMLGRIEAGAEWASIWPSAALTLVCFAALAIMTIACALSLGGSRDAGARVASALARAREAEGRARAFQDSAPDAIVGLDTRFTVVEWNRAAEQLFGYTRAEMIGRHGIEMLVPEDRRPFVTEMLARFVNGNHYTHIGDRIQMSLLRTGGQSVPVEMALAHYKTRQGLVFTMHVRDVRAQRDAAEALRQSERRHRVVVDGLREIIFQADRNGVLTYLNQAWRRTTRFSIEDTLGCTLFEFVVEEDRPKLERLFASLPERASDGMVVDPIEARFLTSELGTRLLLVVAHPLADADGNVTGVVGTVEDITEKRAAEIRLRDQLRFNRDLLEVIPIPVAVRAATGEYLAVNRAWERFAGKDRSVVLGKQLKDLFPGVIADEIALSDGSIIESGGAKTEERLLRAADGGHRTVLHYRSAFVRDNGEASGLITAFVDITEQKVAEAAIRTAKDAAETANRELARQLRFTRALVATIPLPVSFVDPEGRYVEVNQAWERQTGRARENVLGRTPHEVYPEPLAQRFDADRAQLLAEGGSLVTERTIRNAAGEDRDLIYYKNAFTLDDGTVAGYINASVDITDQKRVEAEVRRAKEVAEAANLAKNAFLERISHEVRTPLSGILGMTGLALETDLDTEQREYLASVQSSADNLLHIIDDVLDLPRIEAGEIQLASEPYDVRVVAGAVMRMTALGARAKGIEPLLSVAPDVPQRVSGDADRLRQVLSNLVSNAIKFTDAGEVELAISHRAPGLLEFAVRDTGRGMSAEERERILAAGAGLEGRQRGQAGLGIAIVSHLVRLMGGTPLEIETSEGSGSVFRFALPSDDATDVSTPRHALRALVVADHDRMRTIFAAMLAARGIEAIVVEGAAAAEECVSRAPFDVAFLEAVSAGTDGYALAAALHARAPEVAICMLIDAGVGVGEAVRRGRDGIFAYLRKPVLEGDLDRELALLASDERATPSREPVARAGSPTPTDVRRRGATILVAEDHPVNQALVRRRLQNLGHEVTVVADGASAVEACASTVFDLVLMDVEMPSMDGLEATRRIRGAETTSGRRTPIIALTALAFEHDRELALSAGMDGYLTKPVSPDALAQVLQEHCGTPA